VKPEELIVWRREHKLSRRQFAAALGRSYWTIVYWEQGRHQIPPEMSLTLRGLALKLQEEQEP
jgi:DNA-binding transcriptional regulator YiaG